MPISSSPAYTALKRSLNALISRASATERGGKRVREENRVSDAELPPGATGARGDDPHRRTKVWPSTSNSRCASRVFTSMKATLSAIALFAASLTGCGLGLSDCSAVGCENTVAFNLTGTDLRHEVAYEVEACLDDDCSTATIEVATEDAEGVALTGLGEGPIMLLTDTDQITLTLPQGDYSGAHRVRLVVETAEDGVLVNLDQQTDFEREYPNGPDCEPVCWRAEIAV